jgi:hypothetical protein
MVKKVTVIAFSLCFLVSNNNLHGMNINMIQRGFRENKEFNTMNACKEYIRSFESDINTDNLSFVIKYFTVSSDESNTNKRHCVCACVNFWKRTGDFSYQADPISWEQQLDEQLNRQNSGFLTKDSESAVHELSIRVQRAYGKKPKPLMGMGTIVIEGNK